MQYSTKKFTKNQVDDFTVLDKYWKFCKTRFG